LNKGVTLAFGTDYRLNPSRRSRALRRRNRKARTASRILPRAETYDGQAIAAYTSGAAFAELRRKKGQASARMLADFVVLERDITAAPRRNCWHKGARTVVGG